MPSKPQHRMQRRVLTLALLSVMAVPAYAGVNCQLVDQSTGLPLPIDSTSPGSDSLACGPRAKAVGNRSVSEGDETTATGDNTTAIGSWIDLDADGLVDANEITWANGAKATAIGAAAQALGAGTVAVGVQSVATGANSIAVGNTAQTQSLNTTTTKTTVQGTPNTVTTTTTTTNGPASNQNSIAIGNASRANGNSDIALGNGATVENTINSFSATTTAGVTTLVQTTLSLPASNGIAMGTGAKANGNNTVVIGNGARAEARVGTLITGFGDTSAFYAAGLATNSTVIGAGAASQGTNNVVIGASASTQGDTILPQVDANGVPLKDPVTGFTLYRPVMKDMNSTVVGYSSAAVNGWGAAFGNGAIAYGWQSQAIGTYAYSVGMGSSAVGSYLDYGTAFGAAARPNPSFSGQYGRTVALGIGAQSFGSAAYSWGNYDLAVGPAASTSDFDSTQGGTGHFNSLDPKVINGSAAVGFKADAHGHASVAIGLLSEAHDVESIAIGNQSVAWGIDSIALGAGAVGAWHEDIAIGLDAQIYGGAGISNIAFGARSMVDNLAGGDTSNAIAFGVQAQAMSDNAVALGANAQAFGLDAIAMGNAAQATGASSSAMGDGSQATADYASAFGAYAFAGGMYSTATGTNAFALGANSTAMGYNSIALEDDSVAVGANSVADRANTVSVGSVGYERQVTNVAAGTEDTDAVNVAQLNNALVSIGASSAAQLDTVAAAFGGGAMVDANGLLGTPTYAIQGGSYYNVGDAFTALDGYISGINTTLSNLTTQVNGLASTPGLGMPIGTGNGLAIGGGSNATDATDTAFGTNANVGADSGTAVGSGASIAAVATDSVAVGAGSSVTAASGTAIGQGASVTANGAVAIGQGSVADQANTVSVGSAGNERRVTNVAAGTGATDAANVAQMQDGDAATLQNANAYTDATAQTTVQQANAYTDARIQARDDEFTRLAQDFGRRLDKQDERIDREGAMSAAMLNMAINAANSRSENGRIGVGAGWQNGQSALSVGYSKQIGDRASFSIGGAFSSSEQSAGVGFGIDL